MERNEELIRDPDVLDTCFSSGLVAICNIRLAKIIQDYVEMNFIQLLFW